MFSLTYQQLELEEIILIYITISLILFVYAVVKHLKRLSVKVIGPDKQTNKHKWENN